MARARVWQSFPSTFPPTLPPSSCPLLPHSHLDHEAQASIGLRAPQRHRAPVSLALGRRRWGLARGLVIQDTGASGEVAPPALGVGKGFHAKQSVQQVLRTEVSEHSNGSRPYVFCCISLSRRWYMGLSSFPKPLDNICTCWILQCQPMSHRGC